MEPILFTLVFVAAGLVVVLLVLRSFSQGDLLRQSAGAETDKPLDQDTLSAFREHVNRGNDLLARYEFDRALEEFQEALKLRKNEPSLHFKIGRVFLQKEDYGNAIKAFHNVTQLSPDQIEAYYELARIHITVKNHEEAHKALNQALSIHGDHEEAIKLKIKLLETEGNLSQALPLLQKLITVSHNSRKYRSQYAAILQQLGRNEEALIEYEDLVDRDPSNANQYRVKLGQLHFETGSYAKAIEYFKHALGEDPTLAGDLTIKTQLGAALCNEGVRLFQENNLKAAIQRYEEALGHDPRNADIHYNLGKAYASMHDHDKTLHHYASAVQLSPTDLPSLFELAIIQDQKSMVKESIATYQRILELQPGHAQAAFGLGTLYGFQGNLDLSIRYLTEAIKTDPGYVDAIYNLAVALERQKNFNKAIKMYKKVLSLDAGYREARSNLEHLQHTLKDR